MKTPGNSSTTIRWVVFLTIVLAIILIPFFLFGKEIEDWTRGFVDSATAHPLTAATVLSSMLASDIILPVPSSLASTAAGLLLGFPAGIATSMAGMTVSCIAGYWLGRKCAQPVVAHFVGQQETERLKALSNRFGAWAIVISRPVPVLAEASTVFAGISKMPQGQFLLLSTLSNLGISIVYAAIGAFSAEANTTYSFIIAFAFSMLVPGVAMLLGRKIQNNKCKSATPLAR